MKRPQQRQRPNQQPAPSDPLFKHTPYPDPGQAVESGEPTLTGDEVEREALFLFPPPPDEDARLDPGQR